MWHLIMWCLHLHSKIFWYCLLPSILMNFSCEFSLPAFYLAHLPSTIWTPFCRFLLEYGKPKEHLIFCYPSLWNILLFWISQMSLLTFLLFLVLMHTINTLNIIKYLYLLCWVFGMTGCRQIFHESCQQSHVWESNQYK